MHEKNVSLLLESDTLMVSFFFYSRFVPLCILVPVKVVVLASEKEKHSSSQDFAQASGPRKLHECVVYGCVWLFMVVEWVLYVVVQSESAKDSYGVASFLTFSLALTTMVRYIENIYRIIHRIISAIHSRNSLMIGSFPLGIALLRLQSIYISRLW